MSGHLSTLRFAPSPNGYLHLGHALSALEVARWTAALGGRMLLRIEDTDLGRARPQYAEAILEDLRWLGIAWDGPVRRQSEHLPDYEVALRALWDIGLVYPAPASRTDIARAVEGLDAAGIPWPRDPDGSAHYPFGDRDRAGRRARFDDLPPEMPLRLDTRAALERAGPAARSARTLAAPHAAPVAEPVDPLVWGDVLLRGRDRPATYHLAVVVDDALQGVTHVVRGQDMQPATAIHRLLQEVLRLPAPLYHHHRLVMGQDGRKLSKSEGARSLRALRAAGLDPARLRARLAALASGGA